MNIYICVRTDYLERIIKTYINTSRYHVNRWYAYNTLYCIMRWGGGRLCHMFNKLKKKSGV